jgi:hypothetical protein
LFGTCIETTAAVVNARLLAESEERLQIALSAGNSVGTWDWDVPSDRVFADARFAAIYSVDPERAKVGAPIAEFFAGMHPDDVGRVQAEVAKGMETGEPFSSEYRLPQPDGDDRWVVAQGRCILSSDGKPLRFSGLSFDITERKQAEIRRAALVRLTDCVSTSALAAPLLRAHATDRLREKRACAGELHSRARQHDRGALDLGMVGRLLQDGAGRVRTNSTRSRRAAGNPSYAGEGGRRVADRQTESCRFAAQHSGTTSLGSN